MLADDAHALVIGISRYQHVAQLAEVQDAEDVAAVLTSPHHGAYRADRVALLVDEAATRAAILAKLAELAAAATPSSTIFVYFSGHGGQVVRDADTECYLIPVDTAGSRPDDLEHTAISGRALSEHLYAIPAARITVVLDACRAAGLADTAGAPALPLEPTLSANALSPLARGRGRAVLAASRSDGYAFSHAGQRNSVFTGILLDGLRGAAVGTGGVIRVCDLFHYVQQRVVATERTQRPVFKAELEENYPVALYRGGAVPELVLPPPPDKLAYDAFISYCRSDRADRAWVERVLVPRLEAYGLVVFLAYRDVRIGRPRLTELERAVAQSRYTISVLTPAYLASAFEEFQTVLAQQRAIETREPRFLPVLRADCRPSAAIRTTAALDLSDDTTFDTDVQRLALQLREPPRAPLG